jgi:hypothetical protein
MELRLADIIEAMIDELAMGELSEQIEELALTRTGAGELSLDYGRAGRFKLVVTRV